MQARYYDPVIGRFLSIDPVTFLDTGEPAMFNRYSYAFNDPVNLTDPNGECPICLAVVKQGAKKQVKRSLKKRLLSSGANFEKAEAGIDLAFAAMDGPGALAGEVANIAADKVVGKLKPLKTVKIDSAKSPEAAKHIKDSGADGGVFTCLLYTSPSPRDRQKSRMPSSA